MTSTKLMIAMQDSLLLFESSKTGWKTRESLKGTSPQCVAFDPSNPNLAYCGGLVMDYGIQMMVEKLGKGLERRRKKKKTVVTIAYLAGYR